MKVTITKYYCNHCKKKIKDNTGYRDYRLPFPFTIYETRYDLCDKCMSKFREMVLTFVGVTDRKI